MAAASIKISFSGVAFDRIDDFKKAFPSKKIKQYQELMDESASIDLYNAYHDIVANIKPGKRGVYSAVKQINGGIHVKGQFAEKQIWPDYGFSRWSHNEYGADRKRRDGARSQYGYSMGGIDITINNILDLNWRQGYIALPDKSITIKWKNSMRPLKRLPKVKLGLANQKYTGMTPEDTLIAYMHDVSDHKNVGKNLEAAVELVRDDIQETIMRDIFG